ncbi:MAG: rhomboid family intramembrane serine protease, partial [Actinobacteria bacterium]|nr:rhomboid family intramembrane serine protease [Actinomycetota bacterium]
MLQLIPISDVNPTRRFAFITAAFIALNLIAFIQEPSFGIGEPASRYFFANAPIPCQLEQTCPTGEIGPGLRIPERDLGTFLLSVVYSAFLHAGPLHLAGNMLFLWVFGNNVEDFLGRMKYIAFYLLGGVGASFAHIFWTLATHAERCTNADPGACIPAVGASGAVAAVMGAY